ncbi:MAG: hypothetical protein ACK480_15105 [Planctomycetota bacterium]
MIHSTKESCRDRRAAELFILDRVDPSRHQTARDECYDRPNGQIENRP